jgi:DNA-binding LacI/PurR family transcriptional regulator
MSKTRTTPRVIRSTAEFARYVGLSRSTVSRALNGHPDLRSKTIERVRAALDETGFTPNAHARHLRGTPGTLIGVCMESFATPAAVAKVARLQQRLRESGLTALIEVLDPDASRRTLQHFLSLRVSAVVFIGHFAATQLRGDIAELGRHETPHLVIDEPGIEAANAVSLDRKLAMARVTTDLVQRGHRRFGLLGISGPFQTVTERIAGIHQALREAGLDPASATQSLDPLHVRTEHFEYGRVLAQAFAQQKRRPTAFLAVNDETAVGALLEFQSAGLRVPDDLSIVGFDNQNICLMTRPQLTSVDQQIDQTIDVAVTILLTQLSGVRTARRVVRRIEPVIVERGSTGPAP